MAAWDIVLVGATGFTGGLTAERLATDGPATCAGRSPAATPASSRPSASGWLRSAPLASRWRPCTPIWPTRRRCARSSSGPRSWLSTVGPYMEYGEPLVAACADTGTDYVDIDGRGRVRGPDVARPPPRANGTGARLVHACGFDSIPHDLGAWFTVKQLPEGVPLTISGYVRPGAMISGGTYHSAIRAFSRVRKSSTTAAQRRRSEGRSGSRRVRSLPQRPMRGPDGRGWALPLPTIDPVVIRRSARAMRAVRPGLLATATTPGSAACRWLLQRLLSWAEWWRSRKLPQGRDLLLRLRSTGDGPSSAKRAKSWFTVRFVGEGGGQRVVTEVSGGDPGYDETAMMLAQSALCLAFDDLSPTARTGHDGPGHGRRAARPTAGGWYVVPRS